MPEPEDFSETPEANDLLANALEMIHKDNPELAFQMKEELDAAARGDENILLVGTDGEYSVTIMHVDPSFLEGDQKMMLLPTSSSISILMAISRESLEEKVNICEMIEKSGDFDLADQMWDDFMGELMSKAVAMHKKDPKVF